MKKRENLRFVIGTIIGLIVILFASSLLYNKSYETSRLRMTSNIETVKDKIGVIHTSKGDLKFKFLNDTNPKDLEFFMKLANNRSLRLSIENKNGSILVSSEPENIIPRNKPQNSPLKHDKAGIIGLFHTGDYVYRGRLYITTKPFKKIDGMYGIVARISDGHNVLRNLSKGDIIESIEIKSG